MRNRAPEPTGATYWLMEDERAACGADTSVTATATAERAARVRAMRRPFMRVASSPSGRPLYLGRHLRGDEASVATSGWRPGLFVFLKGVRRENELRGEQEPGNIGSGNAQGG